ncbi:MAG: cytidylate kinase [Chlamydiales bacterium]
MTHPIIAIDGPAASGKSTVARALARSLGLVFLDTGAMYRALTLRVLALEVDPADGERCGQVARDTRITFDDQGNVLIDGEPGEPHIRSARVTALVSQVAAHAEVRASIVPGQRQIASSRGVVAEGRDTTTVVFPHADHKFFLIASAPERARRRAEELGDPGALASIQASIEERDRYDSSREHSPLLEAPDAIRVSTDGKSPETVLAELLAAIEER